MVWASCPQDLTLNTPLITERENTENAALVDTVLEALCYNPEQRFLEKYRQLLRDGKLTYSDLKSLHSIKLISYSDIDDILKLQNTIEQRYSEAEDPPEEAPRMIEKMSYTTYMRILDLKKDFDSFLQQIALMVEKDILIRQDISRISYIAIYSEKNTRHIVDLLYSMTLKIIESPEPSPQEQLHRIRIHIEKFLELQKTLTQCFAHYIDIPDISELRSNHIKYHFGSLLSIFCYYCKTNLPIGPAEESMQKCNDVFFELVKTITKFKEHFKGSENFIANTSLISEIFEMSFNQDKNSLTESLTNYTDLVIKFYKHNNPQQESLEYLYSHLKSNIKNYKLISFDGVLDQYLKYLTKTFNLVEELIGDLLSVIKYSDRDSTLSKINILLNYLFLYEKIDFLDDAAKVQNLVSSIATIDRHHVFAFDELVKHAVARSVVTENLQHGAFRPIASLGQIKWISLFLASPDLQNEPIIINSKAKTVKKLLASLAQLTTAV